MANSGELWGALKILRQSWVRRARAPGVLFREYGGEQDDLPLVPSGGEVVRVDAVALGFGALSTKRPALVAFQPSFSTGETVEPGQTEVRIKLQLTGGSPPGCRSQTTTTRWSRLSLLLRIV